MPTTITPLQKPKQASRNLTQEIETMFQELTETLTCEVNALGYPKAALFGFCLALMAYNAVAVMKAALRAVHGQETVHQDISAYYLA